METFDVTSFKQSLRKDICADLEIWHDKLFHLHKRLLKAQEENNEAEIKHCEMESHLCLGAMASLRKTLDYL